MTQKGGLYIKLFSILSGVRSFSWIFHSWIFFALLW